LLNGTFQSECHFNCSFFQIDQNDFILEINHKQMLVSQYTAVLDKFLSVSDFARTDKVLFFFLNDRFFSPSYSRPKPDCLFVFCIRYEIVIVRKYFDWSFMWILDSRNQCVLKVVSFILVKVQIIVINSKR
jgi:hypothetical protein